MNPLSVLKNPRFWLFIAVVLTAISAILTSPRVFGFARSGPLKDISQGSGHLCSAPFPQGLRRSPKRNILPSDKPVLTENGKPLPYPNASGKAIERDGEGRFRIAGNTVRFSSSDQTSPIQNGRSYAITVSAFRVPEWLLLVLWAIASAAWLVAVIGFRSRCLSALTAVMAGVAWLGVALIKRPLLKIKSLFKLISVKIANGPPLLQRLSSFLLPIPFFAGIVIGLAVCIMAGWHASGVNVYGDRSRFFFQVSPEAYIYPTVDNLYQFVRGKAPLDKTLVLVAGSSIALGVGQQEQHLWTKRLEQELGDEYAVVNVSFRAAKFTSVGLPLMEILSKEYSRCYLITDAVPGMWPGWLQYQRGSRYIYPYDYILWRSWLSGKLLSNPTRDAELTTALTSNNEDIRLHSQESLIHALLENWTFSSNLWNLVGYQYAFTSYSFFLPPHLPFWLPRRLVPDDEHDESVLPSIPERFERYANEASSHVEAQYINKIETQSDGSLRLDKSSEIAILALKQAVPDSALRRHILFLVLSRAPYFVESLNVEKRTKYDMAISEWVRMLDEAGFNAMPMGVNYRPEDYADPTHFSNLASTRMAAEAASMLREIGEKDSSGER